MRVFLAIEHLAEPFLAAAEVDALSRVALPIPTSACEAQRWRSADGRVEFFAWTNEPGAFPARAWIDADGAIGLVGRWSGAGSKPVADEAPGARRTSVQAFHGGSGGIAAYDDPPGIHAWNGTAGMAPMFYQSTDERIVVSNRPLLAHLAATGRTVPVYDSDALPSFLSLGFFPSDLTPFLGLRILARDTDLRLGAGRTAVHPAVDGQAVRESDASAVASALVEACGFLRDATLPVVCNLSGGRDSRIVAAALAVAGVPFTAVTKGTRAHPEVVIATEVARRLGVAHHTGSTASRDTPHSIDVDVEARTLRTLRATDGLLSAWENVDSARPAYDPAIIVNGAGGAVLRGGYARVAQPAELADPDAFWRRLRHAAAPILVSSARAKLSPRAAAVTAIPMATGAARLWRLYLAERVGRWASASAMATAASRALFQPILEGAVVERALGCDPEEARSERIAFEVLRQLRPDLVDLPITARRWSFEVDGPTDLSPEGWPLRRALAVPVDAGGALDWRRTAGAGLDEEFRRRILNAPVRDELFDMLDRTTIERMLAGRSRSGLQTRSLGRTQLLWATYTVATLLSSDWLTEPAARPIRIDIRPTPPADATAPLRRVASCARMAIRRRGQ